MLTETIPQLDTDDPERLAEQMLAIAADHPHVLELIRKKAAGEAHEFRLGALCGMALTYKVLRAELEMVDDRAAAVDGLPDVLAVRELVRATVDVLCQEALLDGPEVRAELLKRVSAEAREMREEL